MDKNFKCSRCGHEFRAEHTNMAGEAQILYRHSGEIILVGRIFPCPTCGFIAKGRGHHTTLGKAELRRHFPSEIPKANKVGVAAI